MSWTVSLDMSRYRQSNQLDTSLTIDGSDPNYANLCGEASCSSVLFYLTGVTKYPDVIQDENPTWGEGFTGPTDAPDLVSNMQQMNGIPGRIWHPSTPAALAKILYGSLFWKKAATYLKQGGNGQGHWVNAISMTGGSSGNPFDSIQRGDPWGGQLIQQTWAEWSTSLMRYIDGNFYAMTWDRLPADLSANTALGPQ